jgi:hypothetical protein
VNLREQILTPLTQIKDRGQRLVELNIELLKAELKEKGARYGGAVALLVAAGVFALFALGFILATIAVALALVLPLWLSLLIVSGALVLLVLVLALTGRSQLQRAASPAPERAVAEAKTTVAMVKGEAELTVETVRGRWSRSAAIVQRPPGQAPPHTPRYPVRPQPPADAEPAPAAPDDDSATSSSHPPETA